MNAAREDRVKEDLLLRSLLNSCPGYLDLDDPTPIAFDSKTFEWLNAKELMQRDSRFK